MSADPGRWLMCRPEFFDVTYEINPWMKVTSPPARSRAADQWEKLYATMLKLGAQVDLVTPSKTQPDLVFTANAGLVSDGKCLLSHFRHKERSGEQEIFKQWFVSNGFKIHIPKAKFEGEGDALAAGDVTYLGFPYRSDREVADEIKNYLGIEKISTLELVDPYFYHLDTCFCPLPGKFAFYCKQAFSPESLAKLQANLELWEAPHNEARKFACNSVLIGKSVIVPAGCPETCNKFKEHGFTPYEVELDEFIKSGGAAKCLVLRLTG